MRIHRFCSVVAISALLALAQTPPPKAKLGAMIYVGALSKEILAIDEEQEKVVDRIPLQTGVPRNLVLSFDRKKIYVQTVKDSGIEVVDLAARKVINHFILNEGNRKLRIHGLAAEPQDRVLYAAFTAAVKQADRFELEKPKFAVIDLAQKKITKTVDFPKDDDSIFSAFGGYRVSPDGKFLYVFRENIHIYDTSDFKLVEKIELSKPLDPYPWMQTVNLGPGDDPHDEPGVVTSVFNATDPIVRRSIFGIARVDLSRRSFDFTPVGPATTGMAGLRLTPDRKIGYTVAFLGSGGNRRTEFWVFDMPTRKLVNRVEFGGPINFRFTLAGSGRQLYIYGTSPFMEIYDAATLKLRKTIEVNADMTTGLIVVPSRPT